MIREEKLENITKEDDEPKEVAAAFAVRGNTKPFAIDKSHLLCTVCNKGGHGAKSCFQIIGYPDWWIENNKQGGGGGNCDSGRGGCDVARVAGILPLVVVQLVVLRPSKARRIQYLYCLRRASTNRGSNTVELEYMVRALLLHKSDGRPWPI